MTEKIEKIPMKLILLIIGAGIWITVLQNAGIIPSKQNVFVMGGNIDAEVSGKVNIDRMVDINIQAINGHREAFFDHTKKHPGIYYRLPVYTGQ